MDVNTKVREAVGELTAVLDTTEKTKDNAETLKKLSSRLNKVTDGAEDYTEAIRVVLGADRVGTYRAMIEQADSLARAIGNVTTPATPEVAHLAEDLRSLTSWLEGELASEVGTVLGRWDSMKPKRSMSGASSKPDLGFTVRVKCETCNETIASTQKHNVNSLRDAVKEHHGKKHGVKFARGDATFTGLTAAIKAVMEDGAGQAQGGGYVVLKGA